MAKSAQEIVANWQAAMRDPRTAEKYKKGIQAYQGNPMQQAATPEATARYLAGVQAAITSGKRNNALQSAPVGRWKDNASGTGAASLSTGATKAGPKLMDRMNYWAGVYAQASAAAKAIDKSNWLERMRVNAQTMIDAKGKG